MAKNNNLKDYLVDLYQGIASRKPNASKNPQDFRSEIENLVFTSDANAAASDIRAGKTAYVNDVKITGTIKDYDDVCEEGSVVTDMLQAKIDNNNSCEDLFQGYTGTSDDFIASFSKLNTSKVTNMYRMFYKCVNLTTIPQFDTSNVTNMNRMFQSCINLRTIPQLDTSKVTDMSSMFYDCRKLTTIPQLDTSSCTDMESMFHYCENLTTIPQLDTSKVTNMGYMFYGCINLKTIDITHMKATGNFNTNNFAVSCYSLTKLIIRNMDKIPTLNSNAFDGAYHFNGTTNSKYNPNGLKDARIYVPDDKVEALKAANGWAAYADIIVPLSTLEE